MNYFNYFTEIETRFQQRRGSILMLSTLDWALIETWRDAGVPLEAVLRGIDTAFDNREAQSLRNPRRQRKVNGLAWCAQAVVDAVAQTREAAVGVAPAAGQLQQADRESGFEATRIARFLRQNAAQLDVAVLKLAASPASGSPAAGSAAISAAAARLRTLATGLLLALRNPAEETASTPAEPPLSLEELDRTLTVLEEKIVAALLTATPEAELVALREQAARELAPYRGRMQAVQIRQIQQQFLQKRLLEVHALPRLSLFYMPHEHEDANEDEA